MKEYIVINQENVVNGVLDQKVIPITIRLEKIEEND